MAAILVIQVAHVNLLTSLMARKLAFVLKKNKPSACLSRGFVSDIT